MTAFHAAAPGRHGFSAGSLSNGWMEQLQRLYDRGTVACLDATGVGAGWRCLEVGAGGGSVAHWLAGRAGPGGEVVATDLDVGALQPAPNLRVVRHDIERDPLEAAGYDLVHARLVLEHLRDPPAALARMAQAVCPGGWLVVEDLSWASLCALPGPGAEVFERVAAAMRSWMVAGGYPADLGVRLPRMVRGLGFRDVGCEARAALIEGGTPSAEEFMGKVLRMFGPLYVRSGLLSADDLTAGLAWTRDPANAGFSALLVATWGRAPGEHRPDIDSRSRE